MLYVQCTLMGVLENSFPSKQSKAVKMNRFTLIRLLKKLKKKKTLVGIGLRIIPSYKNEVEKFYSTLFIRLYYYYHHHYYYNYYCY